MIPFALYLMVFALPLVTLYHAGAFTMDNVNSIATYMTVLAFALPVYGVNTYLQKIFSSLRKMGVFAAFNFVAGAAQIALTMFGAANVERFPIEIIAAAEVLFYVVADVCLFAYLRRRLAEPAYYTPACGRWRKRARAAFCSAAWAPRRAAACCSRCRCLSRRCPVPSRRPSPTCWPVASWRLW